MLAKFGTLLAPKNARHSFYYWPLISLLSRKCTRGLKTFISKAIPSPETGKFCWDVPHPTPLPANSRPFINMIFRLQKKILPKGHRLISRRRTPVWIILSFKICHGKQSAKNHNHPIQEENTNYPRRLCRAPVGVECYPWRLCRSPVTVGCESPHCRQCSVLSAPRPAFPLPRCPQQTQKRSQSEPGGSLGPGTTHPCPSALSFPWPGSLSKI